VATAPARRTRKAAAPKAAPVAPAAIEPVEVEAESAPETTPETTPPAVDVPETLDEREQRLLEDLAAASTVDEVKAVIAAANEANGLTPGGKPVGYIDDDGNPTDGPICAECFSGGWAELDARHDGVNHVSCEHGEWPR